MGVTKFDCIMLSVMGFTVEISSGVVRDMCQNGRTTGGVAHPKKCKNRWTTALRRNENAVHGIPFSRLFAIQCYSNILRYAAVEHLPLRRMEQVNHTDS